MIEYFNEDCMEGMKRYPDKHFDLAICDPPYFVEYAKETFPGAAVSTTGVQRRRFKSTHWEVPNQKYFEELLRVSKNQIVWGYNYYPIENLGSGRIVWDKQNDSSSFSKCEIAYCSLHKSVQMFRYLWNGMLQGDMKNKELRIHPTQKPVALYKWILSSHAKPGDLILDTHVGSASSLLACHLLGFNAVGFELDEDYYRTSKERLDRAMNQLGLFGDGEETA